MGNLTGMQSLVARCFEVREWQRTGLLSDGELRRYANARYPDLPEHQRLMQTERQTADEAMDFVLSRVSFTGAEVKPPEPYASGGPQG